MNLVVRPLARSEWHLVEEDFRRQFQTSMPTSEAANKFFGVFLGEKLIGFAHLERMFHLNAVYLKEEHRNLRVMEGVFDIVDGDIPAGFPAVIFPYKNIEKILNKYGFESSGEILVYRKEY